MDLHTLLQLVAIVVVRGGALAYVVAPVFTHRKNRSYPKER